MDIPSAINQFSMDLFPQLSDEENLFFSPLGIYILLGILYEGARDSTRNELSKLLHRDEKLSLAEHLGHLQSKLNAGIKTHEDEETVSNKHSSSSDELDNQLIPFSDADPPELSIANGIWIQDTYKCKEVFLDSMRSKLAAKIEALDFKGNPIQACNTVNEWIHEETRGKIGPMLSPLQISPLTRVILTNALYFKANWEEEFGEPEPGAFYLLDGEQIEVPMMTKVCWRLGHKRADEFSVVKLPYYDSTISMFVFSPHTNSAESLTALEEGLPKHWDMIRSEGLEHRNVTLTMPEFKIESGYELSTHLAQMGIDTIFHEGADFSGMSEERGFYVNSILHNTYISVDRYGTEAAATGMAEMLGMGEETEEGIPFMLDHPFLFLIADEASGVILFLGKVLNPA